MIVLRPTYIYTYSIRGDVVDVGGGCFAAKRFAASPRALRATGVNLPVAVYTMYSFLQKPCIRRSSEPRPTGFPKMYGTEVPYFTRVRSQGRSVIGHPHRAVVRLRPFGCDAAAIALDAAAL
jgi:hypothetical protein